MLAVGDLDTAFGAGGVVVASAGVNNDGVSVVQQADGKLITTSRTTTGTGWETHYSLTLNRYSTDGTLDRNFGANGTLTYQNPKWTDAHPHASAIQTDGKLIVVGAVMAYDEHGSRLQHVGVVRFNPDGTPDVTFGSGGSVTAQLGVGWYDSWLGGWGSFPPASEANCVAIQTDGKIVVAGRAWGGSSDVGMVARLNSDGSFDTSFGKNGSLLKDLGEYGYFTSVACRNDGRVMLGGIYKHSPWLYENAGSDVALVSLNANGSTDASFHGGLVVDRTAYHNDLVYSLSVQADGKLLVAGVCSNGGDDRESFVARYNVDGSRDSTFGSAGFAFTGGMTSVGSGYVQLKSVATQKSGMIVATGTRITGGLSQGVLVRFTRDGRVDPAIAGGVAVLGADIMPSGIALQRDGQSVVVGSKTEAGRTSLVVGRIITNTPPSALAITSQSVSENQSVGTVVGFLRGIDADGDTSFTYSIVSSLDTLATSTFVIAGEELRTRVSLDFEAKSTYSLRVRATDAGGLWREDTITIAVKNVNEAPTSALLSAVEVAENQLPGAVIGTFSTADPDKEDTFTYTLIAGTGSSDNAKFVIDGSILKTTASFNFEDKATYSIRVKATDAGGFVTRKVFALSIKDVNEAPADIVFGGLGLFENRAPGTVAGVLSTIDQDRGDTFKYNLIRGPGDTDNAMFTIDGNVLKTSRQLNFESKSRLSVRLKATDAGGLVTRKSIALDVGDVKEPFAVDHVDPPPTKTYKAGETVRFEVALTRPAVVVGKPEIDLTIGTNHAKATYQGGSGTSRLAFTYIVKPGDSAPNGVILGNALQYSTRASIRLDLANLPPVLPPVGTSGVRIDAASPKVSQLTGPTSWIYGTGDSLWFTATMSEAVSVAGVPALPLIIGTTARQAVFVAEKSTPTAMVFEYAVQPGDNDVDGITVGSAITLPSGAVIQDFSGNAAGLAIKPPSLIGVAVDATGPTAIGFTVSGSRTYRAGESIEFKLSFNEVVQVAGVPVLPLKIGESARSAAFIGFAAGSGNKGLVFRTSLIAGDLDSDGIAVAGQLGLDDAFITDMVGNAYSGVVPTVDTKKVLVDALAPGILSASVPILSSDGTTLTVRVTCTEAVIVTGKPAISFQLGSSNRSLSYISGSGFTSLLFVYKVNKKVDDMRLPIALGSVITLNGSTIRDTVGNGLGSTGLPRPTVS